MNKTIILLAVIALVATGSYFVFAQDPMGGGMMGGGMMGGGMMGNQQSAWQASPAAANRRNPVPANSNSTTAGKTLFDSYCASCHGMNAKGNNGVAADLTAPAVQSQTDGALFWKISQGRSPMPSFANTLTAHQGWDIINYIRTLASAPAQDQPNQTTMMQPGMGGGMRGQGMMGGNMQANRMMGGGMQGRGMMGMMMRSSSLVATSDGGIIALMGNELSKYDKDLNLVKQVEINFNWDNWQKTMMQHRNMMMQNFGMTGGNSTMGFGGMMGPMMRSTSLVAGPDGGVIVLMGNELLKYDNDLNLVKKVEINFNWDNWQKTMMQHRNMMMNRPQQSGSQSSQGQ
jgi:mono/diheme cytochrome c family protein/metal-sulfur cluster biosynthetic enzyme